MPITIPNNNVVTQSNIGDSFGDIFASFNLDLTSNLGKIRIAPRTKKITTVSDVATLITPAAIVRSSARATDEWWVLCNQALLRSNGNSNPTTAYIADATANTPTTTLSSLYSDMKNWNSSMFVSTLTNIARLTAGTWTASWWQGTLAQSALTTGIPHPLCVAFNNLLCIANGATMYTVSTANVVDSAVILPAEYQIQWLISSNSAVWIGAESQAGGEAKVFMWDGFSENYNQDYRVGDLKVYCGVIKNEVPYIVNGNGQLMAYKGGMFAEVARFPIADNKYRQLNSSVTTPIHRNGIAVINGRINISLRYSPGVFDDFVDNMPSGIWEYTKETGLYHKHGLTNTLATTFDFGSALISWPGAIVQTDKVYGGLLGCASVYTDNVTTIIGMIYNLDIVDGSGNITDSTLKTGYLISPKLRSSQIEDVWQKVFLNFKKFANSTDQLIVKYLSTDKVYTAPTQAKACTWATSTTFTSASSQVWSDVSVGDEIEILTGQGAGITAHITAISLVAATYTITIDYTLTGVSVDNFACRVRNWTKLKTIQNQVIENDEVALGGANAVTNSNSNWVKLKIVFFAKGNSPELDKLTIISQPHLTSV